MKGAALAACIGAALLSTPAHAQLFGGDDTARKQIAEQAKRVDELKQQQEALAARVAGLEEAAKRAQGPIFELLSQIEQLRKDVMGLRGQIEVLGNNIESTAKRQRDMYVDLDTRLRRLEQGAAAPAAAAGATAAGTAAPAAGAPGVTAAAAPVAAPSGDETRAYEAAQNQRRIGNYQGAIVAFQAFLEQHPKSALAHRAQYWIGDSHYNLRDFKAAIANQQKLIATYPDSASVPDAMLNIASSQLELGDVAAARKTLESVIARHPASDAAEKAKRRLANLR